MGRVRFDGEAREGGEHLGRGRVGGGGGRRPFCSVHFVGGCEVETLDLARSKLRGCERRESRTEGTTAKTND